MKPVFGPPLSTPPKHVTVPPYHGGNNCQVMVPLRGSAYCVPGSRCKRRKARVISFSVPCPGNMHRNKNVLCSDLLTPSLSTEERLRPRLNMQR